MDWAQILVITMALLFTVFLIIAIALAALLLKVTRQIKATAASAERTVNALEDTVGTFRKTALPMMMAKGVLSQVVKRTRKK